MIIQFLINGLISGLIISLVSIGFAMVYNTTRIFHLAYSSVYTATPFLAFYLIFTLGFGIWYSFILAILGTMVLSISMDTMIYKQLEKRQSSGNALLISSIGIMIVVINLIVLGWGNETKILNPAISSAITFKNVMITKTQLYQFLISLGLIAAFLVVLRLTKLGVVLRAIRDNQVLAAVFGLNIRKARIFLFAASGFFASIGALLIAWDVGFDPYVGMAMLLNSIVALIIGGVGNFVAPVIGGIILGLLHAFSVYYFSVNWLELVTFSLLILFLIFRPMGILGETKREV